MWDRKIFDRDLLKIYRDMRRGVVGGLEVG